MRIGSRNVLVGSRAVASLGAAAFLGALAPAASAQIDVNGGPQGVAWTAACGATITFKNNTNLPLAGLWVGINNDGVTNAPEIADIRVHDTLAGRTWDVDDNEDRDNGDAGEADETDATPLGLATGWHRVQARANADVFAVGENFTIRLCDSGGGSLAGRTVFLIPQAPQPGQVGGDQSFRTELPFGIQESAPTGGVGIDPAGAPPASNNFSVAITNTDGVKRLKKVKINPPGGVTILSASASGGGVYDAPSRTIIWPTPIALGASTQVNVSLSGLVRPLFTSVTFDGTFVLILGGPGPVLPLWGLGAAIAAFALAGYRRLGRRRQ